MTFASPLHHPTKRFIFCYLLHQVITLLRKALRLRVVPKKSFVFQLPAPDALSIRDHMHMLPPEFQFIDTAYRLAGGPVGTLAGRKAFLIELVTTYKTLVNDSSTSPACTPTESYWSSPYAPAPPPGSTTTSESSSQRYPRRWQATCVRSQSRS